MHSSSRVPLVSETVLVVDESRRTTEYCVAKLPVAEIFRVSFTRLMTCGVCDPEKAVEFLFFSGIGEVDFLHCGHDGCTAHPGALSDDTAGALDGVASATGLEGRVAVDNVAVAPLNLTPGPGVIPISSLQTLSQATRYAGRG